MRLRRLLVALILLATAMADQQKLIITGPIPHHAVAGQSVVIEYALYGVGDPEAPVLNVRDVSLKVTNSNGAEQYFPANSLLGDGTTEKRSIVLTLAGRTVLQMVQNDPRAIPVSNSSTLLLVVDAAAPAAVLFEPELDGAVAVAGTDIFYTLQLRDRFGNLAVNNDGFTLDISVAGSVASAQQPAGGRETLLFYGGQASGIISSTKCQRLEVTLLCPSDGAKPFDLNTFASISVLPATATYISLSGSSEGTVDAIHVTTAEARDPYDNYVSTAVMNLDAFFIDSTTDAVLYSTAVHIRNGKSDISFSTTTPRWVRLQLACSLCSEMDVSKTIFHFVIRAGAAVAIIILDPKERDSRVVSHEGSTDTYTTVTMVAHDQYGNLAEEEERDFALLLSGSAAFLSSSSVVDLQTGQGSSVIVNSRSETVTLAISDISHTGLDVSYILSVTFAAGTARRTVILPVADTAVGAVAVIHVQVQDQHGNVVPSAQTAVTVVSTGSVTGAGRVDIINGQGLLYVSDNVMETVQLSLCDSDDIGLETSSKVVLSFVAPTWELSSANHGAARMRVRLGELNANSRLVRVQLTLAELNAVKKLINFATTTQNTFLTFSDESLFDMAGNPLLARNLSNPLQVTQYTADSTAPTLTGFDLLMRNGRPPLVVLLRFSETVNVSSFSASAITLRNGSATSLFSHQMANSSVVTTENSDTLEVEVGPEDLAAIKRQSTVGSPGTTGEGLARQLSSTFMSLPAGSVQDMVGLNSEQVASTEAQQVSLHNADLTPPFLVSFDFNLNQGTLRLQYSEKLVNTSALDISKVTLHDSSDGEGVNIMLQTTNASVVQSSVSVIIISLSVVDLDLIKAKPSLASLSANTFLALLSGSVTDPAGNKADPIASPDLLAVMTFTPDTTAPAIQRFDLDLSNGTLVLHFSETVNGSSLAPTELFLQNAENNAITAVQLTGGSVTGGFATKLTVQLDVADLNVLKAALDLATSASDTFLALTERRDGSGNLRPSRALQDMAGNPVDNILATAALPVAVFVADAKPANLIQFALDMSLGALWLTFDKPVNISSFLLTDVVLSQGTQNHSTEYTLTGGSVTRNQNKLQGVVIILSAADLNAIKRLPVCNAEDQQESCYLYHSSSLVRDNANLAVRQRFKADALKAAGYTVDTVAPTLVGFVSFSLMTGRIALDFSETINVSSLQVKHLTLQTSDVAGLPEDGLSQVNITGATLISSEDSTHLIFELDVDSLNRVKLDALVCTVARSCYLSTDFGLVNDMAGNTLNAIFLGVRVQSLARDTQAPILLAYSLDMTLDLIMLTFSEPVLTSSLVLTRIGFQPTANSTQAAGSYGLTGGETTSPNGLIIIAALSSTDGNALRARAVASAITDTFIAFSRDLVRDMAFIGNQVQPVFNTSALQVMQYTADTRRPRLVSFTLNLLVDKPFMQLQFNEAVNKSSFDPTGIMLQSQPNASAPSALSYALTGGVVEAQVDSFVHGAAVLTLELSSFDLVVLKSNLQLAVTTRNTFLAMAENTVVDMAQNKVLGIKTVTAQQVATVIEDTSPTRLIEAHLDLEAHELTLVFDDVMAPSSLLISAVEVQDKVTASSSSKKVTLATSSTSSPDGYFAVIALSRSDLLAMYRAAGIASNINNTYIVMGASAFNDVYGVDVITVTDGKALKVDTFVPDQTRPTLVEYSFNLNLGTLIMSFSEALDSNFFNASSLTLYNTDGEAVPLSSQSALEFTSTQEAVTVTLLATDLNAVKALPSLAFSAASTLLNASSALTQDYFANPLFPATAIMAEQFFADTTAPQLLSFSVNLTLGHLQLTFSEVINVSSILVSGNLVAASDTSNSTTVTLTGGSAEKVDMGTVVQLQLVTADLEALQLATSLFVDLATTYIGLSRDLVRDMAGNQVVEIGAFKQAASFVADAKAPSLVSFAVNMNNGTLSLRFDEPMLSSSLNASALTLQSNANVTQATVVVLRLRGGEIQSGNGRVLLYDMSIANLLALQSQPELYVSRATSYLSVESTFLTDMAGNLLNAISETAALQAVFYEGDSTEPLLTAFDLDINATIARLTLRFPKTVNVSTLQFTSITLQKAGSVNLSDSSSHHQLTGGTVLSASNGPIVEVQLSTADLDQMKLKRLATSDSTAWLTMASGGILDMGGVPSQVRVNGESALSVTLLTPDTTQPRLEAFDVDMNEGTLSFFFNEPVLADSLDVTQILLQNTETAP